MRGLNTNPAHGHTVLFGVYGMLGIGLMLFCLKTLRPTTSEEERLLKFTFWSLNIGLSAMVLLSFLPIGNWQVWTSIEHGMCCARRQRNKAGAIVHCNERKGISPNALSPFCPLAGPFVIVAPQLSVRLGQA